MRWLDEIDYLVVRKPMSDHNPKFIWGRMFLLVILIDSNSIENHCANSPQINSRH